MLSLCLIEGKRRSLEPGCVYVCMLRPQDSGCTWLPLGLCFGRLDQTFSYILSLCFEKHCADPSLIFSESKTKSLTKYFQRPARSALCSGETLFSALPHAVLLPVFASPQTLSQSPCIFASATSLSRRGISPSMTVRR